MDIQGYDDEDLANKRTRARRARRKASKAKKDGKDLTISAKDTNGQTSSDSPIVSSPDIELQRTIAGLRSAFD